MGNGDRPVFLTHFLDPFRPDRVGEVGPVVVAFVQFLPTGFEGLLPFGEAEEFPEGAGGDEDAVVEVGFPLGGPEGEFGVQVLQLVEEGLGVGQLFALFGAGFVRGEDGAQVVDAIKAFSEGVHPGSAAVPELAESLSGSPFCMYVCIRNTS